MQKDMLAAKTEFKAAQKKRNLSLQKKNNIEKNIRVSSLHYLAVFLLLILFGKECQSKSVRFFPILGF